VAATYVIGDRVQLLWPKPINAKTARHHARIVRAEAKRREKLGCLPEKRGWVVKTAVINKVVKYAVRVDGVKHREWYAAHEIELVNPLERLAEEAAK
jgi:hypothetical protein